ncbi:MAG: hypothetical protein RSC43_00220 [Clostridia bacterium]
MIGHITKGSRYISMSTGKPYRLDRLVQPMYDGFYEFVEMPIKTGGRAVATPIKRVGYNVYLDAVSFDVWGTLHPDIPEADVKNFRNECIQIMSQGYLQFNTKMFKIVYAASQGNFASEVISPQSAKRLYDKFMNVLHVESPTVDYEQHVMSNIVKALSDTRTVNIARYIRKQLIAGIGHQEKNTSDEFLLSFYNAFQVKLPPVDFEHQPFMLQLGKTFLNKKLATGYLGETFVTATFASGQHVHCSILDAISKYRKNCETHNAMAFLSRDHGALVAIYGRTEQTYIKMLATWKPRLRMLYGNVTTADPVTGETDIPEKYRSKFTDMRDADRCCSD